MTHPTTHSDKLYSIELMRILAMLAIIFIHSQALQSAPLYNGSPWLGYIVNQLCRFAVPFFFITAGYFIQPKLSREPRATLINYIKPLGKVWLVWSLICLAMPFQFEVVASRGYWVERSEYLQWLLQAPLNSLLEGGLVHLWYIPGLICGLAVITILQRYADNRLTWMIAGLLYVYGVLAGSYQELTGLWSPFYTRNGPFFSTLMIFLGYEIRRNRWSLSFRKAMTLLWVGMAAHFAEAAWLSGHDVVFSVHDYLFGTLLWGGGLFMWMLSNPQAVSTWKWLLPLSSLTLGVYVAHMPIIILLKNLADSFDLGSLPSDALVYLGTILITYPLVWLLTITPLKKILFR